MNENVRDYYGKVLQSSDDLKTDACCTDTDLPGYIKAALSDVHDEVLARYYGCGLIAPEALDGLSVLDLGSGSGRDAYVLSRLVGEQGRVVGVDMTDEQLAVANAHIDYHRTRYGYADSNVRFLKGYLEDLDSLDLDAGSFDVIISNCVINLCEDKAAVLKSAYRLLKPGGEMYFSDVYADRRVPVALTKDPVLHGECLSGALYWNDFLQTARAAGFLDPRLVEDRPLAIGDDAIRAKLGDIRFYSATYRLFKLDGLDISQEDYGQSVTYRGSVPHHSAVFTFDKALQLPAGVPTPVSGNSYAMLQASRFASHFDFHGDGASHRGIFADSIAVGGPTMPFTDDDSSAPASGGCC